jgi:hypothetical protein
MDNMTAEDTTGARRADLGEMGFCSMAALMSCLLAPRVGVRGVREVGL